MPHMPGNQGHPIRDWWKGFQKRLKENQDDRSKQFANYLSMVDSLSKKRVSQDKINAARMESYTQKI